MVGESAPSEEGRTDDALRLMEEGVVVGLGDRDVDVMPGAGLAMIAAVIVGPGGDIGDALPRFQERGDGCLRRWREPSLGDLAGHAVADPPPGEGGTDHHRRRQGRDRKSTRLNSSHRSLSRMPSSA